MGCFILQQRGRYFSNPLVGLSVSDAGKAGLSPHAFSCCDDQRAELCRDRSLYICPAQRRLGKVQKLLDQYHRLWKAPFPSLKLGAQPRIQEFFHAMTCMEKTPVRGSIFRSGSRQNLGSDYIWLMAVLSVWRFEYHPHVVTIGRSGADELLPAGIPNDDSYRPLILVDQAAPFRLPHFRSDFELLVGWAEGAEAPLWMDVVHEVFKAPPAALSNSALREYHQRIRRFRNTPPLADCSQGTISRLSSVSSGYQKYVGYTLE